VRQLQPGQQHLFYESHGFTPDGTKIVFSGNLEPGQGESGDDIYTLELATGVLTNLTNTPTQWDEHAQVRPQGDWIVWMSSMGEGGTVGASGPKTDYWIMRPDGSAKRQLTYFNVGGHAESIPGGATAADSSWSPDGTRLMAYVILDPTRGTGRTLLLEFTQAGAAGPGPDGRE